MREYSFRHVPKVRQTVWAIKDGHLMKRGGKAALRLSDVIHAEWSEGAYRGTRYGVFDLSASGLNLRVECRDDGNQEDRDAFVDLVISICEALPDGLQIDAGSRPGLIKRLFGPGKMLTPSDLISELRPDGFAVNVP